MDVCYFQSSHRCEELFTSVHNYLSRLFLSIFAGTRRNTIRAHQPIRESIFQPSQVCEETLWILEFIVVIRSFNLHRCAKNYLGTLPSYLSTPFQPSQVCEELLPCGRTSYTSATFNLRRCAKNYLGPLMTGRIYGFQPSQVCEELPVVAPGLPI